METDIVGAFQFSDEIVRCDPLGRGKLINVTHKDVLAQCKLPLIWSVEISNLDANVWRARWIIDHIAEVSGMVGEVVLDTSYRAAYEKALKTYARDPQVQFLALGEDVPVWGLLRAKD